MPLNCPPPWSCTQMSPYLVEVTRLPTSRSHIKGRGGKESLSGRQGAGGAGGASCPPDQPCEPGNAHFNGLAVGGLVAHWSAGWQLPLPGDPSNGRRMQASYC